jgi:hypothetical protein
MAVEILKNAASDTIEKKRGGEKTLVLSPV